LKNKKKNIFSSLKKYNHKIAIKDEKLGNISYRELIFDVDKFKIKFSSKKLILILSNNSYEFLLLFIAAVKYDQLVLLSNPDLSHKEILQICKKYEPDYIFCKNEFTTNKNYKINSRFNDYYLYEKSSKKTYKINPSLSCLLSTSGTTGDTKFVKISRENLYDNTIKISNTLKINSKDIAITTMPPYYSYALSVINTHLYKGASIIINNYSVINRNFWKLFEKFKPNNINGVPYIYEILEKINFEKLNIKSLKYITQAGGKIENNLKHKLINICKKKNIKFYIMYGQTEASPRISIMPWHLLKKFPDSVGYPLNGGKVWIKNKFQHNQKTYGEIIYKGKNVFQGYSTSYKDLNSQIKNVNIIKTGDLGFIDAKGLIYITGRKKRILKIFGIRISLDNIEEELKKDNLNCICTGDDKKLKVLVKSKIDIEKLSNKIKYITKLPKSYFEIINTKEFKRNDIGKIIYK